VKKTTHIYIANQVANQFKNPPLTNYEKQQLELGSVVPDVWRDYPHHYGKEAAIKKRVTLARKAWLCNQNAQACFELGVAFHYLADKWTLMRGSDPRHTKWEKEIDNCKIFWDTTMVVDYRGIAETEKNGYVTTIKYLHNTPIGKTQTLEKVLITRPSIWSNPNIDLNMAYRVCLTAAQSALGPREAPAEIQQKIEKSGNIVKSILSNRCFQIAWFTLFFLALGGTFAIVSYFPGFIISLLALLPLEIWATSMFLLTKQPPFRLVHAFGGINVAGKGIVASIVIFVYTSLYIHFIFESITATIIIITIIISLIFQEGLQLVYLNRKAKLTSLFTYTNWFVDGCRQTPPSDGPKTSTNP
jgi:hypothetical protein